jgi:hypothetical protein
VLILIGGDGRGLASSTTLEDTTATADAAASRGFAATGRSGGFAAATGAGLALTGGGLFRHYIYIII